MLFHTLHGKLHMSNVKPMNPFFKLKVFNTNKDFRKFIVVTSDGLPYKQMIDLIKHTHTCASCGKRLNYLSDMRDHWKETHHSEYFQTYGNILPNIGHFHYCLTMLQSLVNFSGILIIKNWSKLYTLKHQKHCSAKKK